MPRRDVRPVMMIGLWMMSGFVLIALLISAGIQGEMTLWHMIFGICLMAMAFLGTIFIARSNFGETTEIGKAKRQRIDNFLRDLSDEDLLQLKQRLADGNLEEEAILDYLTDDGELIIRE